MDPLSITASIIAVTQLAGKIVSVCAKYVRNVKDAPNDLRIIMIEVGSVKGIAEALQHLVPHERDDDASAALRSLQSVHAPLEGCKQALTALDSLFPSEIERAPDGKRRKLHLSLESLAWPLLAHKAKKLLDDVGRHKATISLALMTQTMFV